VLLEIRCQEWTVKRDGNVQRIEDAGERTELDGFFAVLDVVDDGFAYPCDRGKGYTGEPGTLAVVADHVSEVGHCKYIFTVKTVSICFQVDAVSEEADELTIFAALAVKTIVRMKIQPDENRDN